ncbi:MAG: hypothetical protein IJS68_01395 [Clostridia bacterium]|nr:hypothetical protein [Clostridia bacterium]
MKNKCSGCGGDCRFDTESGELKCKYCGSLKHFEKEMAQNVKMQLSSAPNLTSGEAQERFKYCQTCKTASIVENKTTSCPSCGANNLVDGSKISHIPNGIIPFSINEEKAKECLRLWLKKRKFAPLALKKLAKTQEMTGFYVPAFVFDMDAKTHYSGVGINKYKTSDGHYSSRRYSFSDTRTDKYRDYLLSGNSNVMQGYELRQIGDYNYDKLNVYSSEYLYGFIAADVIAQPKSAFDTESKQIEDGIRRQVKNSLGYDEYSFFSCDTTFENVRYNYVYLPVWANIYDYKGKQYKGFINGQTGKVSAKYPKSFWKILLLILGIGAGIAAIVALCMKFFG